MKEFIIAEWNNNRRKLFKAHCATCNADRGYKKPAKLKGNCRSCQGKIKAKTLNIIKQCITCNSVHVPNPYKHWFAGPTCYKCYNKKYRKINKKSIRKNIDTWRKTNNERHTASEIRWRLKNKEHKNDIDRAWRIANKDHIKILQNTYIKRRTLIDNNFKMTRILRARLNSALKNTQKVGSAVRDLGCSIEDLKKHLEAKFQPGMTWTNWSNKGWHIDHIKPLSSFDLSNREELLKACHYSNLQPLWWYDNISKGNK